MLRELRDEAYCEAHRAFVSGPVALHLVRRQALYLLRAFGHKRRQTLNKGGGVVPCLGAGTGPVEYAFERILGRQYRTVSLELANRKCQKIRSLQLPMNTVLNADMRRLPLEDNSVHCMVLLNAYHHVPRNDRDGLTNEIIRVTADGGIVLMQEPFAKPWRLPAKWLFRKRWKSYHDAEERELTPGDLVYLHQRPELSNISVRPFTFLYQPLLYAGFPSGVMASALRLVALDRLLCRAGIGWTYWVVAEVRKS